MQKLQNRAARVITKSSYNVSSSILIEKLHWDNLSLRREKHKSILMYKTINKPAPEYLQNLFSFRSTDYNLRNAEMKGRSSRGGEIIKKRLIIKKKDY